MRHRNHEGTGREIIDSFECPSPEHHYNAIQNMALSTQKKFSHCSQIIKHSYDVKRVTDELRAKKFPFILSTKIEWLEPNEENKLEQRKEHKEVMIGDSSPT